MKGMWDSTIDMYMHCLKHAEPLDYAIAQPLVQKYLQHGLTKEPTELVEALKSAIVKKEFSKQKDENRRQIDHHLNDLCSRYIKTLLEYH
jgi:hypothetical protein